MTQQNDNGALAVLDQKPSPEQVLAQRRERLIVQDNSEVGYLMDSAKFEHLQRIASAMSLMSVLPDHLCIDRNKNPLHLDVVKANCFRIVNQALRWRIDPYAMVDETFVVGGKLGYQGKLVAAVVNSRAGLKQRLSYTFEGERDDRTVTVWGTFEGEDEARSVSLRLGDARTQNQMWQKDPDQKLIYSGVVKWARRYCPEIVLGVITETDEIPQPVLTGPAAVAARSMPLDERVKQARQQNDSPAAAVAPAASAPEPEPAAGSEVSPSTSEPVSGTESVNTDTGEVVEKEDPRWRNWRRGSP
jgi:hypothetical protein